MRDTADAIHEIQIQIHRIAINASVRSAHIGASETRSITSAEVMHRLVRDSSDVTRDVTAAIDSMSEAAGRVSASNPDGSDGGMDTNTVLEGCVKPSSNCIPPASVASPSSAKSRPADQG